MKRLVVNKNDLLSWASQVRQDYISETIIHGFFLNYGYNIEIEDEKVEELDEKH